MKSLLVLALLFTSHAFAQDTLVFADGALKADVTWELGPRIPDISKMKIEWKSGADDSRLEPPGPVKISLWMPMHGHGSSPVTINKLGQEPGIYEVTDMYFTMPGDWEVKVNLKYTNGNEETRVVPAKIPARRR